MGGGWMKLLEAPEGALALRKLHPRGRYRHVASRTTNPSTVLRQELMQHCRLRTMTVEVYTGSVLLYHTLELPWARSTDSCS